MPTDTSIAPEGINILRHSLGLRQNGLGRSHRNHFVTGEESTDWPICMALVDAGLMIRRRGSALSGGDDIFMVTEAGMLAASPIKEGGEHVPT